MMLKIIVIRSQGCRNLLLFATTIRSSTDKPNEGMSVMDINEGGDWECCAEIGCCQGPKLVLLANVEK